MKKIYLLLSLLIICVSSLFAQVPEKFTYQAVVRNASNQLVINAQVGVRVNILQGSASGNAVYSESHVTSSNANGLVTVNIGGGSVLHGSFEGIDWSDGPYFLKTDIDPNGGNDYSITSVQQLLSVPYALYAKEAANGFSGDYNDLTNTPQIPTVPTNVSAFTNDAGYITSTQVPAQVNADWNATSGAAEILNKPAIPTVPTNVSAFTNDAGYITSAAIPTIPTVPTNVSAFTNDAGYITSAQVPVQVNADWNATSGAAQILNKPTLFSGNYNDLINKPTLFDGNYNSLSNRPNFAAVATSGNYNDLINKPAIPTAVGELTNNVGYITLAQVPAQVNADWNATSGAAQILNRPTLFSGNYNDLTNKPTIPTVPTNVSAFNNDAGYITNNDIPAVPTVPTNVSAFTNDAGYLTSYTETDPQFSAWDKDYNDLTNKPVIPTVPTNVSAFTNDAGYLTSFTEQQVLSISHDTLFLTGGSFVKLPAGFDGDYNSLINQPEIPTVPTDVSAFNNDAGYITSADIPSVPTNVSQLNNDAGYITAAQCGDVDICALVNLVQQLQSQVESLQSSLDSIKNQGGEVQTALPTVTTNTVISITSTSVTCGGNVTSDGGASVTARGVCWSTSQNPTVSNSHTTDGSGTGSFSSSISGLTANTTYYVRAYATNSAGTAYGETVAFTTLSAGGTAIIDAKSCPAAPTVTDHEGNVYATVQIGDQCWMRDNLRTTTSPSTGTYLIPASSTGYTYTGKQARWYNNYSATYAPMNYGLLYNWNAAVDTFNTTYGETSVNTSSSNAVSVTFTGHRRGICPAGWHLPNDADWTQLTDYVSSQSEYTCGGDNNNIAKALASTEGWNSYSGECYPGDQSVMANNATGFSAVPAGFCYNSLSSYAGSSAFFWSSTQYSFSGAWYYQLSYAGVGVYRYGDGKDFGYSVRCLRDESGNADTIVIPTDTTATPDDTTTVTAGVPCPGTPTVTDHEGNVYATVQIGDQCWMRDNLRTTTSPSTGTYLIPASSTGYTYTGKQARWYNNDSATYAPMNYGLLYNWNAAVDTFNTAYGETSVNSTDGNAVSVTFNGHRRGICPAGWHLPNDADWTQLTDYVSSQSEYTCGGDNNNIAKALASTEGWGSSSDNCDVGNDPSTNNATGFSAVPAGACDGSSFYYAGYLAFFWSSTQDYSGNAYGRYLDYYGADVGRYDNDKYDGFSVRCLRDETGGGESTVTLPAVSTNAVSGITATSATSGGNIIADGGASVTARGVCWSTSQNPTVNDSHTADGSGMGSFSSSISGLTANTTYYVRAYATNSAGTAYGETVAFTTLSAGGTAIIDAKSCPEAQTVTDHEGNVYSTVQIGNQCWMRDNLRTTTSPSTGTYLIPAEGTTYTYTGKQAIWYNNDSTTYAPQNYGLLYNWNAAVDTFNIAFGETSVDSSESNAVSMNFTGFRRGICPVGWHLPSDEEWTQLTDYVSSQSEYTCGSMNTYIAKALASTTSWNTNTNHTCVVGYDQSTNNATGFSAIPAGEGAGSLFIPTGMAAEFVSCTQYSGSEAWARALIYYHMGVVRIYGVKYGALSVRCLRDAESGGGSTVQLPSVTTTTLSNIASSTATCGGNVTSDGGATVTACGVCWSTSQNPTVNGNHTISGTGMGSFTSNLTGLAAGTTYYVRAYATNSVGTAYGNEVSFTALSAAVVDEKSCPAALTVTDHEGNVYATVQIGSQCWMRDNLRTSTSPSTGTYLIPVPGTYLTYTGKQARWYDNDPATYALQNYGLLYNWNAAVDTFNTAYGETSVNSDYGNSVFVSFTGQRRGICPAGWHLPSDAEVTQLTDYVKSQSQYVCGSDNTHIAKALASTTGWNTSTRTCAIGNDQSANNAARFSAVPAGGFTSLFESAGFNASFWSISQNSIYSAWYGLYYDYTIVHCQNSVTDERATGISVRCLRD